LVGAEPALGVSPSRKVPACGACARRKVILDAITSPGQFILARAYVPAKVGFLQDNDALVLLFRGMEAQLMARAIHLLFVSLLVFGLFGAPYAYYRVHQLRYRGFRVVTPNVLYRSGQLDYHGFRQIIKEYGIRTVVNLREEDHRNADDSWWEEDCCSENGVVFVRIPARQWRGVRRSPPPALKPVREFVEVMNDPVAYPRPVLLHCFAGIHRTGAFCALYRIECQGWSAADAVADMERCGYTDPEEDVLEFICTYRPSWELEPPAERASEKRRKVAGR
jgi:hypothetical protein